MCKVVLRNKPIAFLTSSLPSPSSLLKIPNHDYDYRPNWTAQSSEPINHKFNKLCDIIGYFLNQNTRNSKFCFASNEKKSYLSATVMAGTVQLRRHDAYCPIKLSK